ncbi:DNA-binding protein [Bacillus subtilis]|uniref:DNA-binding protein n=1 Tax=Bacillus subtilis TaxID=1423 RepID=UPI002D78CA50|nr:DNA-binding protein [Bacillus subtilis]WRU08175.1 DNA-binding protein [Bacillus subtilis]
MVSHNENGDQFGYFAKDVAISLNVTPSTLRRWSLELEKHGYSFERNDKEQRIYFERDFKAFRELQKLLSNSVPFTDAVKAVSSTNIEGKNATKTQSVSSDQLRFSERELREIINEEVKAAVESEREMMFRAFEQKMNNIIERRDRSLMNEFRKAREQQLIETAASSENSGEPSKKSFWKRLFSK